ncbi:sesquipedalian-1-like [Denticeps clupeoides]|uniref:Sesquipedalian n=1 Tax=Denticeps clupeoides TaxID=299321 RepID=A0AAY4APT8_9TELE|nr:sesquipedalian-1-like [Denticeps clupeoides]
MKLHEKILSHYLSCSSPVDKLGYLYKKGEVNTSYQKRWCVLKGNLLFYKERPGDGEVLGVIVLEGCTVQLCESEENFAFSLVFSQPGLRTYKFAAEDQPGQESWIKALLRANHRYLALLVKDLQEKYQEAARALGADPIQPVGQRSEAMAHSRSVNPSSVFYSQNLAATATLPAASSSARVSARSNRPPSRRSPRIRPRLSNHALPDGAAPPQGARPEPMDDFKQLHEYFGQEVKELMADWLQRRQGYAVQEGDLIDLG